MGWERSLVSTALMLVAMDASAQPSPPPPPALVPTPPLPVLPPPPPPPSLSSPSPPPPTDPLWADDYEAARQRMLAGAFEDAADRFEALAARATDDSQRALATDMAGIARSYATRGLTLVARADQGTSAPQGPRRGERTTDEIAQLYLNMLPYGVGTGLWLDTVLQPSSAAGLILPLLVVTGASAGTVAAIDLSHPMRYGVPQSAVSGLYLGLEEGILLTLWNQAQDDYNARWSPEGIASAIWVTSTLGMVGGGVLGSTVGTTPGRASFVGTAGLWGGVIVGLGALAVSSGTGGSGSGSGPLLAADVGLNLGIMGGLVAAGPVSPSIARVRFLDLGGLAGGLLAGGLYAAAADKSIDGKLSAATIALGAGAGLGFAWWATRNMAEDRPETPGPATGVSWEPSLLPAPGGAALGVRGSM